MERIYKQEKKEMKALKAFLQKYDLKVDGLIDEIYVMKNRDAIVASGALYGNILKCIACEKSDLYYINTMMTHLVKRAYELGHKDLFIYTKPKTYKSFEYFGFKKIAQTENVVLMENSLEGIENYKDQLRSFKRPGVVGSVVVNCNPFTLGHQYLIKYAASRCDHLHVFIVSEDASTFPFDIRKMLIEKGTQDIKNITLHNGENYIISKATFPSYFLADDIELTVEQTYLDLNIFCEHIAKVLGISKRFVGEEPFNETTLSYNRTMKKVLRNCGIEVEEIKRIATTETVSASKVRAYIYQGNYEAIKHLVPQSTYEFIVSDACLPIVEKIKKTYKKEKLV